MRRELGTVAVLQRRSDGITNGGKKFGRQVGEVLVRAFNNGLLMLELIVVGQHLKLTSRAL